MSFFLYDSLEKNKREFIPLDPKNIRVYACGPTVYNYAHVGNARMAVVCDLLVRVLKTKFKKVTYVSNITDIDDKIIEASKKSNTSIIELTKNFTNIYNQDMNGIGVTKPDVQPNATKHIKDMIVLIKKLVDNGCAYKAKGNVLFDVKKFNNYGILSGRNKEEQIAGSRVEVADYKKNPQDFILWKPSKNNEPSWESPWGKGRPGWHIEGSAMSEKCLGIPFDIHCGGVDLTFPHHENEIAQTCSAHKLNSSPKSYCNFWFHNGFVTINGEKMSKSIGNIQIVNDLLKKYTGDSIRLSLLSSHYRQPLDWSETILSQSEKTLSKFLKIKEDMDSFEEEKDDNLFKEFMNPLYDDLNTPKALAVLNIWISEMKKESNSKKKKLKFSINKALNLLGLNFKKNNKNKIIKKINITKQEILKMIDERNLARKNSDFKKADEIRDRLKRNNVDLEDTPQETIWKISGD